MKIVIKKFGGGECDMEVLPITSIPDIKRHVWKKFGIPVEEQKLLLMGRTLADDQIVASYPSIKDGTRLNVVVKKPEGLYKVSIKYFKKRGMNDAEAVNTAKKLLRIVEEKFNKLSWDDINRLSMDCLMHEQNQKQKPVQGDPECDEMFTL